MVIIADSVSVEAGVEHACTLQSLHLDSHLYAVSVSIASLPVSLTRLALYNCRLSALPAAVSTLQQLTELEVAASSFGAASSSVLTSLTKLELLCLSDCHLATVPLELTALTGLRYLYLDDNPDITGEQLEVLSGLTGLRVLSVPGCRLSALPVAVSTLKSLDMLFCHENDLATLTGASSWLGRLKVLSLGLADLCRCQDLLKYAESLVTLYIDRSSIDIAERGCSGLLDALLALPILKSVYYVRSKTSVDPDWQTPANFEFQRVLLKLQSKSGCEVDCIERGDIVWV